MSYYQRENPFARPIQFTGYSLSQPHRTQSRSYNSTGYDNNNSNINVSTSTSRINIGTATNTNNYIKSNNNNVSMYNSNSKYMDYGSIGTVNGNPFQKSKYDQIFSRKQYQSQGKSTLKYNSNQYSKYAHNYNSNSNNNVSNLNINNNNNVNSSKLIPALTHSYNNNSNNGNIIDQSTTTKYNKAQYNTYTNNNNNTNSNTNYESMYFPPSRYQTKRKLKQLDAQAWKRQKQEQQRYKLQHYGADALRYSTYSNSYSTAHTSFNNNNNHKNSNYMNNNNNINSNGRYQDQSKQQLSVRSSRNAGGTDRKLFRDRSRDGQQQPLRSKNNYDNSNSKSISNININNINNNGNQYDIYEKYRATQNTPNQQYMMQLYKQQQQQQPYQQYQYNNNNNKNNEQSCTSINKTIKTNNNNEQSYSKYKYNNDYNDSMISKSRFNDKQDNYKYSNNSQNTQNRTSINRQQYNDYGYENNKNSGYFPKQYQNQQLQLNNESQFTRSKTNLTRGMSFNQKLPQFTKSGQKYQQFDYDDFGKPGSGKSLQSADSNLISDKFGQALQHQMSYGSNADRDRPWGRQNQKKNFYDSDYINQDDEPINRGPLNAMKFSSSSQSDSSNQKFRKSKPSRFSLSKSSPFRPQKIIYQGRQYFQLKLITD